jgi:hypothetical protein
VTVKTGGELLFEKYLNEHGIKFEYEPPISGTSKLIDYVVKHRTHGQILFEVKDIHHQPPVGSLTAFDPHKEIRIKIAKGTGKFKDLPDELCVLVLVAATGSFADLLSPRIMLGAMYGDWGVTIPVNPVLGHFDASKIEPRFLVGKGKMVRPNCFINTRIAALVSLTNYDTSSKDGVKYIMTDDGRTKEDRWTDIRNGSVKFSETASVTVWENGTAKRRLPQDIFRGEMDAWWTCDEEKQTLSFVGQKRLALKIDK